MLKRAAVAVVCLLVLAGCKVDADITVTMKPDGSGTIDTFITLDAEAVARVEVSGRTLDTAFPLDDLKTAGWTISPWTRGADGSATLRLQHDFAGAKELDQRITELVGPTQLLRDPRLIRRRGVLRSHDEIALTADLRHPSTGIQQDPALVAGLQGGRSRRRHPRPAAPERAPRGAVGLGDGEGTGEQGRDGAGAGG